MMKTLSRLFLIAAALFCVGAPAHSAKVWEMLRVEKVDGRHVVSDNEIEIKTAPGKIYVSTTKHVGIKVFTILGSVVSETTLSPGKHSFDVPAHGVYIIKAGDITCKVAV